MSIFRERKLSLNHWRYRLLHWCFNEKNITSPEESALPQYLYCHYCPLFHLTNFIALFSWLILTIKVIVWACKGIASAIAKVDWSFLRVDFLKFFKREHVEHEPSSEEELRKAQWKLFLQKIKHDINCDFEHFWRCNDHHFGLLDKNEAEIRFERIVAKLRSDEERARIFREKMQARIAFLVNFGRHLVKGLMYGACAGVGMSVAYLVFVFYEPVIVFFGNIFAWIGDVIAWLLTLELPDIMPLLIIGGKIVLAVLSLTGFIMLIRRFRVIQKCGRAIQKTARVCLLMPLLFLVRMIGFPFMLLWKGLLIAKIFIGEFYEDHCPPITIVDDNGEAFGEAAA